MKKKLSVGFVLVIVLALAAVTALAASLLWEQQYVPMKEIEKSEGNYMNWPISQKQALVRSLIASGNIHDSSLTAELFDDTTAAKTKHAIADQLLLTLTGCTDVKEITIDLITYSILGFEDTWTPEQRVWWQDVTNQLYGSQGSTDTLVLPSADVISEAEAISLARTALIEAWGYSEDQLSRVLTVADLYVTENRPDYRRWNIQFKILKEGSDSYAELVHNVVVDEYGQVIADPDRGATTPKESFEKWNNMATYTKTPLFQEIDALAERADFMPFRTWTLELKAEYSKLIAPQVREIINGGDLSPLVNGGEGPDLSVMAFSTFTYGVPGEQDIKQGEALNLAKCAMMETFCLSDAIMAEYDDISVYFDVSDPDAPLWKFLFTANLESPNFWSRYKVEINARTGIVTKTDAIEYRKTLERDFEYELRYY